MLKLSLVPLFVALLAKVQGQVQEYGQCGGIGYSGSTTCVSPYVCVVSNPYYSQCLPGSGGSNPTTTTTTTRGGGGSTSSSSSTRPTSVSTSISGCPSVVNSPFTKTLIANSYYASEISTAVAAFKSQGDTTNANKAASVASIPTFVWLDTAAKVPSMAGYLAQAGSTGLAQFVVYDLPDRDCAALASNGEYSVANNGVANYKAYIDSIATQLKAYPSTSVVLVIEPDSLPNLVTNMNVAKCQEAHDAYITCVEYALKTLNLPNVAMYIDAGHAGWLGWSANVGPAAQLFAQVWQAAGSPKAVRGLATNVANYNAYDNGGHPDPVTQGDPATDEQQYVAEIAPLLCQYGFPAHFIIDTGRSGVQNIRTAWGDWCNVKGAGFGIRPTTSTGNSLVDAFVWVKPGGECDGTSNSSSPRYDAHCGQSDALQPAPEAGTWFEAYFEALVKNANPPL